MYYILDKKTNKKLCITPFNTKEEAKKEIEQIKIDTAGSIYEGSWNDATIRKAPKKWAYKVAYTNIYSKYKSSKILGYKDFNKFIKNAFIKITEVKAILLYQDEYNEIIEKL